MRKRRDNPSIDELEQLWLVVLDEMQESGAIARYKTAVTLPDGTQRDHEVVRLGTFNLSPAAITCTSCPRPDASWSSAASPQGAS